MTIRDIKNEIRDRLKPIVGDGEADAMSKLILEEVKGYTPVELVIHADRELLPETIERLRAITGKVAAGHPLQYVLGAAWWGGRRFMVNPSVLIPRPETSELVDIIVDENKGRSDLSVLDIGTGSGCIAVTLALDLPFPKVMAIDISEDALSTAAANAHALKAKVDYLRADIFDEANTALQGKAFDIIVSNPPYVLESERPDIDPRVRNYEPQAALFVDDSKKIDIYLRIIDYATTNLNHGGKLYLEINPLCAESIRQALKDSCLDDAEILRDYKGNLRYATAIRR